LAPVAIIAAVLSEVPAIMRTSGGNPNSIDALKAMVSMGVPGVTTCGNQSVRSPTSRNHAGQRLACAS